MLRMLVIAAAVLLLGFVAPARAVPTVGSEAWLNSPDEYAVYTAGSEGYTAVPISSHNRVWVTGCAANR